MGESMLTLGPYLCLIIVAVAAFMFTVYMHAKGVSPRPWEDQFSTDEKLGGGQADQERLKDIYDRRMKIHNSAGTSLTRNLQLQATLIAFSLIIMITHVDEVPIEIFKLNVKSQWLLFTFPLGFLYLLLSFGYLFNLVLDNRRILVRLIRVLESRIVPAKSMYSAELLLRDGFLVDAWFLAFCRGEVIIQENRATRRFNRFLLFLFGMFFALAIACALATICTGYSRFADSPLYRLAVVVYGLAVAGIIWLHHYQFRNTSGHDNSLHIVRLSLQLAVLYGATLLTVILTLLTLRT